GLGELFSTPTNQAIRDTVLNNMDTYVSNIVNTDTIDELLTSSDNVQNQRVVIQARDITGGLNFNQNIQSNIIAKNLTETVVSRLIDNQDVERLMNDIEGSQESVAKSPITTVIEDLASVGRSAFSGLSIAILAVIVIVVLIIIAAII